MVFREEKNNKRNRCRITITSSIVGSVKSLLSFANNL